MKRRNVNASVHGDKPKRDLGKYHRKCDLSIRDVVPKWDNIFVTNHALDGFVERFPQEDKCLNAIVDKIKKCVIHGRRSDHSKTLLDEIAPYLQFVSWVNNGRPVTLFMDEENLCCLVARDYERHDQLVVLTCFVAA